MPKPEREMVSVVIDYGLPSARAFAVVPADNESALELRTAGAFKRAADGQTVTLVGPFKHGSFDQHVEVTVLDPENWSE